MGIKQPPPELNTANSTWPTRHGQLAVGQLAAGQFKSSIELFKIKLKKKISIFVIRISFRILSLMTLLRRFLKISVTLVPRRIVLHQVSHVKLANASWP